MTLYLPNLITLSRVLLTPLFLYFLFANKPYFNIFALLVFIIAAITDAYDGYVARKYASITHIGKFLDPLADKILVSAAFISFVVLDLIPLWMVIIIILRDFIITILRIIINSKGFSIITSNAAKGKTAVQIGVISFILVYIITQTWKIFLGIAPYLSLIEKYYVLDIIMFFTTVFTVYTGIQYIIVNKNVIMKILKL